MIKHIDKHSNKIYIKTSNWATWPRALAALLPNCWLAKDLWCSSSVTALNNAGFHFLCLFIRNRNNYHRIIGYENYYVENQFLAPTFPTWETLLSGKGIWWLWSLFSAHQPPPPYPPGHILWFMWYVDAPSSEWCHTSNLSTRSIRSGIPKPSGIGESVGPPATRWSIAPPATRPPSSPSRLRLPSSSPSLPRGPTYTGTSLQIFPSGLFPFTNSDNILNFF